MLRLREGGPEWIIPTSLDQMSAWGLLRCGWGGGGEEKSITCNGFWGLLCIAIAITISIAITLRFHLCLITISTAIAITIMIYNVCV